VRFARISPFRLKGLLVGGSGAFELPTISPGEVTEWVLLPVTAFSFFESDAGGAANLGKGPSIYRQGNRTDDIAALPGEMHGTKPNSAPCSPGPIGTPAVTPVPGQKTLM
jgi:hypothetical protein